MILLRGSQIDLKLAVLIIDDQFGIIQKSLYNSSGTCSKSSEVVMMSELAASLDDGGRDARETR